MPLLQHQRSPPQAVGKATSKTKESPQYDTLNASPVSPASSSGSTAMSSPTRPRLASEELIVPAVESVSSVYYGVDSFSPTLVDFYTVDQKRIVWSSRAHRKMMMTLHRAWHAQEWKQVSMSYWAGVFGSAAYTLMLMGFMGEVLAHHDAPDAVHFLVDGPLLAGAICLLVMHLLSYFEVINSCHNLEIWLDEYFHGYEPVLHRRYVGFFPSRIDFWNTTLGIVGSLLYITARCVVLVRSDPGQNYGVISVSRLDASLIFGYWVPMFVGSFLLLVSAYLGHVEVVHRWFSWRLGRLETWVTAMAMLSAIGLFLSSTLQFVDPMSVIFPFRACIAPFGIGCVIGICACFLSLLELESIHKRHKHPEYGLLKPASGGYGTWENSA